MVGFEIFLKIKRDSVKSRNAFYTVSRAICLCHTHKLCLITVFKLLPYVAVAFGSACLFDYCLFKSVADIIKPFDGGAVFPVDARNALTDVA